MGVNLSFFFLIFYTVHSFNFNTNNYIIYVDPEKDKNPSLSTYFGYSVVLLPGNQTHPDKWRVKIGAPRGTHPKIKFTKPGLVYDCSFKEKCRPSDIYTDFKYGSLTNSWIGGTMDVSYEFNKLTVCGFRTLIHGSDIVGSCCLSNINGSEQLNQIIIPLDDIGKRTYQERVFYYGLGEAGFSAHFPNNEDALILGAPGVYNWAGTLIKVTDVENPIAAKSTEDPKQSLHRRKREIVFDTADTINSYFESFQLFGYAINSGYFFGRKKLYYASSMPKSNYYTGEVVIFDFQGKKAVAKKASVVGSQFGEYFGAAIAAGDINNDGYDDLIVGAPYHAKTTYNEGSVYIFLGSKKGLTMYGADGNTPFNGESINSQFGSAVMFLGDMNNDGYGEVAIGAPYAEGHSGILYIYRGNKKCLDYLPSQKIVGKNISPDIRGFGISISRPADIDGNGFKDLLVGAHLSANAVLLRSRATIVIKYTMTSIPKQLMVESTNFILYACYSYTNYSESSVDIQRNVIVDELLNRGTLMGANDKIVTLKRDVFVCENMNISLKNKNNFDAPVKVSLSYKLSQQPQKKSVLFISDKIVGGNDMFDIRHPILDELYSSHPSFIEVAYRLGCGNDNMCQSDLQIIGIEVSNLDKNGHLNFTFIVGSFDDIHLLTTVKNYGEKAYSAQLEVVLPDIISFKKIPPLCQEQNKSSMLCNIGNPLENNSQNIIDLLLNMEDINKINYGSELNIFLRTLTTSNDDSPGWQRLILTLKIDAYITIHGKSEQQSFSFGNITHGASKFTQTYQIQKVGVSPLEKVTVEIAIPYAIHTSKYDIQFLEVYEQKDIFASESVTCNSTFNYVMETNIVETSDKLEDDSTSKRTRRQLQGFQNDSSKETGYDLKNKKPEITPSMTYFLNCSMNIVVCSSIVCSIGPFNNIRNQASLQIKMLFNTSKISSLIGSKKMVLFTTHGSAVIENSQTFTQNRNRSNFVDVSSLFINEMIETKPIALWIIIVSAIAGLLLLILVVLGLYKAGFFKRQKKDALKHLIAEAAVEGQIEDDVILDPPIHASSEGLVDEECEKK